MYIYIESRHGDDLSVHQFSDPTRECIYRESRHEDLSVHQFSDPTRESIYIERVDMETICQCINSLILQESVYIESRYGEDLSVYQFSDPTRECIYKD